MTRIVIPLDDTTAQALEAYRQDHADRLERRIMQEALEAFLMKAGYLPQSKHTRPLPKSVGIARSGRSDLAEHDEELLWVEA
ncbi:MAG: hypothetical protein HC933_16925 [Pleurocapsa sp. SU_196_0]|nr:hypothetical protein [Pleurocapsa sp. SU_196_0]